MEIQSKLFVHVGVVGGLGNNTFIKKKISTVRFLSLILHVRHEEKNLAVALSLPRAQKAD